MKTEEQEWVEILLLELFDNRMGIGWKFALKCESALIQDVPIDFHVFINMALNSLISNQCSIFMVSLVFLAYWEHVDI